MAEIGKNLFEVIERDENYLIKNRDRKMPKQDKMARALQTAPHLELHRHLTQQETQEMKDMEYTEIDDRRIFTEILERRSPKELPFAKKYSPEAAIVGLGLREQLIRAQQIMATTSLQEYLAAVEPGKGTKYATTFKVVTGHGPGTIRIAPVAANTDSQYVEERKLLAELNGLLADVGSVALKDAFRDEVTEIYKRQWATQASLTFGHHNQCGLSSVYLNYSSLNDEKRESLGSRKDNHTDIFDDARRWSVLILLSNFPEDHYPGRFTLHGPRLTFTAETFTIFLFSGKGPHGGSGHGKYEENVDLALRYQRPNFPEYPAALPVDPKHSELKRMHAILYPNKACLEAETLQLADDILHEPKFIEGHAIAFGTHQNRQELRMRVHIRDNIDDIADEEEATDMCKQFGWEDESGEMQYPREEIATMAFKQDEAEDKAWKRLNNQYLDVNCGQIVPGREQNEQEKGDKERRRRLRQGHVKYNCEALTKSGKVCGKKCEEHPEGKFCRIHLKGKKAKFEDAVEDDAGDDAEDR